MLPRVLLLSLLIAATHAQTPPPAGVREVRPGHFEVGGVQIDQAARTATVPTEVNLLTGLLEYALVTTQGSTHESLLATKVQPSDLHLAMVLLGAKGAGIHAPAADQLPSGRLTRDFLQRAPELRGDAVTLRVRWQHDGATKEAPLEDWIVFNQTGKPADRGPWIYNGSAFNPDGKFAAQVDGSFISTVVNPAALICNPRKGNDNDVLWEVNEKAVPPVGTSVELIVALPPSTPPQP